MVALGWFPTSVRTIEDGSGQEFIYTDAIRKAQIDALEVHVMKHVFDSVYNWVSVNIGDGGSDG